VGSISEYIVKLWAPETYMKRDYADMTLEEVEQKVKAMRAGRRGRPEYSAEEVAWHIWQESVEPDRGEIEAEKKRGLYKSKVKELLGSLSVDELKILCKLAGAEEYGEPSISMDEAAAAIGAENFKKLMVALREDQYHEYKQGRDGHGNGSSGGRGQSERRRWQDHKRH